MIKQHQSSLFPAVKFSVALALSVLSFSGAIAQSLSASDVPSESAAPTSAMELDEVKLDKFVDALVAVQGIQKEAAAKQSTTPDPSAAKVLQAETQAKMSDAVVQSGLQVEEFNRISQLMLQDTDLRARINAKLQQRGNYGG